MGDLRVFGLLMMNLMMISRSFEKYGEYSLKQAFVHWEVLPCGVLFAAMPTLRCWILVR